VDMMLAAKVHICVVAASTVVFCHVVSADLFP